MRRRAPREDDQDDANTSYGGSARIVGIGVRARQEVKPKSTNLTMTLAWIADAGDPMAYVFVINGVVAYKTVDGSMELNT